MEKKLLFKHFYICCVGKMFYFHSRYLSGVSDTSKEKLGVGGDLEGGGSDMGPSAALTPAIWDKTIPYDGENFHLEYMDLEEFLMENGIPNLPDEDSSKSGPGKTEGKAGKVDTAKVVNMPTVALLPIDELDNSKKDVVIITKSDSDIICDATTGKGSKPDGELCHFGKG